MECLQPLDYFYGNEAEQFTFYRIPKVLFTEQRYQVTSTEAKVLYGLMLDRMSLSVKNHWVDEKNRVYIIFAVDEIMEQLGCGNQKAVKLLHELDEKAGLIERHRQGQGKKNIIYVKNFNSVQADTQKKTGIPWTKSFKQTSQKCENHISKRQKGMTNRGNIRDLKCENHISKGVKTTSPEVWKSHQNDIEVNHTKLNKINPIFSLPEEVEGKAATPDGTRGKLSASVQGKSPPPDAGITYLAYERLIKDAISYELLIQERPEDAGLLREIVELVVEVCCSQRPMIRIAKEERPASVVKGKLLKLNMEHIRYALQCLRENTTEVRNIKQYLLAVLYNAPQTICGYYRMRVNHDLFGSA